MTWGQNDLGAKQPQFAPNSAVLWSGDKSVIRDKIYLSTLDSPLIVNTQPVIGLSSLEHHPGYSLCCWMTSWNYALIQSLIIFLVPPGYSKVKLILLSIWYHCTRRRANARNVKARLHRRFLLRSFSFWCMWLNGLTYECIRPSVQSYILKSILLWLNHSIACVRMRKIATKISCVNVPLDYTICIGSTYTVHRPFYISICKVVSYFYN